MFLFPGSYDLRITLSGYLPLSDRFTVSQNDSKNIFNYILTKNAGTLRLEVNPAHATIKISKKVVDNRDFYELVPGTYQIEVEAETYNSYKEKVEISLDETQTEQIILKQRRGKLQFSLNSHRSKDLLVN